MCHPLKEKKLSQIFLGTLFCIYDFSETWVAENIDNVIGKFVRKWFQLPVSANIEHLSFPTNKLGLWLTTLLVHQLEA